MGRRSSCLVVAVSFLAILCVGGCGRHIRAGASAFTESGIPARQFLVGGGFEIHYVVPSDGTLFWVEESGQRILVMRSVTKGEEVSLGGSPDPQFLKDTFGMDMKDVKFSLYFVPAKAENGED